jgi:hypothetical protein
MNFFEYMHYALVFEKENYSYFLYFIGFIVIFLFMFNYYQIFKFIQNIFKKKSSSIKNTHYEENPIKYIKINKKKDPEIILDSKDIKFESNRKLKVSSFLD